MSKKEWSNEEIEKLISLRMDKLTWDEISEKIPGISSNGARKAFYRYTRDSITPKGNHAPKILIFDIETAPIEAYVWGLFDQNIGLEMVKQHTTVLSWSAKWHGKDEVMYRDLRDKEDKRDDKELVQVIRDLLDEADIVITQNGKRFDIKKLNYRMVVHNIKPPAPFKHIDTLLVAKKNFGFDSNKLAHMTALLCKTYKKQDHGEFAGAKLWVECLKNNQKAFKSMEVYNKYDVLSLEELYFEHLAKWDNSINFDIYSNNVRYRCNCGSEDFTKHKKYEYTKKGKFAVWKCEVCGKHHRDTENLFTTSKKKSLRA